jgi:hypothetical protein
MRDHSWSSTGGWSSAGLTCGWTEARKRSWQAYLDGYGCDRSGKPAGRQACALSARHMRRRFAGSATALEHMRGRRERAQVRCRGGAVAGDESRTEADARHAKKDDDCDQPEDIDAPRSALTTRPRRE